MQFKTCFRFLEHENIYADCDIYDRKYFNNSIYVYVKNAYLWMYYDYRLYCYIISCNCILVIIYFCSAFLVEGVFINYAKFFR